MNNKMNTPRVLIRGSIDARLDGQSIDDLLMAYMEENQIPALTLAIVQAPYITRLIGYGFSDKAAKRLASTKTVFNIGEMTQGYTAVAVMQLKEEGKLHLEDRLGLFIKTIPAAWHSITIRDLLTHSSGIPDYTQCPFFKPSSDYRVIDFMKLIHESPLLFKPGTKVHHSATNPYLLGLIIEASSGMTYQEHITKNQIHRLGLKNTLFISNVDDMEHKLSTASSESPLFLSDPSYMNPAEVATGYETVDKILTPVSKTSWTASFAASGIIASGEDISLWDIALAGSILIKEKSNRDFLYNHVIINKKSVPGHAGWTFPGHPGLMFLRGNAPGYSTILTRFTDEAELLCVTLLANKGNLPDLDVLSRKIAAALEHTLRIPECAPWSDIIQSPYSVKETIERASHWVKKQGGTVFAHINHSDEATSAHQSLPETEVLIFGNPVKGTILMQKNAAIALDLPLRIMATQDELGQVWLSYVDPVKLAKAYHLDSEHLVEVQQVAHAIRCLCQSVVSSESELN